MLLKKLLSFFLFSFAAASVAQAQCDGNINHWEAAVKDNVVWKYTVPSSNIPQWFSPTFNDVSWSSGQGGIGFGDGDDNTLIPTSSVSVYMRRSFFITDTAAIAIAVFHMDYDDGFVAYLNGKEIARANMVGTPNYNSYASAIAEAQLYQGGQPNFSIVLPKAALDTLIVNGNNTLAVEVHNANAGSTDLSSRPFLHFGITNTSFNYTTSASWFQPPVFFQTQLPIVKINTLGQQIVDNPRINCRMSIIHNGDGNLNCVNDLPNAYDGGISIEYRGSTSQGFPKKPYGFSTIDQNGADSNVSLLGFPKEHDWIFLAPYTDKTFMRDVLVYDFARALNWYASRAQFVELFVNGNYMGVYALLEKIKWDDNRVDVKKLTPQMNSGDELTGGYIYKIDKTTGNSGPGFNTAIMDVEIQYQRPKWNTITTAQKNYLQTFCNAFEGALFSSNFSDPNSGYRKYANIYSFVDFFLLNELSNNIDGYRLSTFMHKDRDSRCGRFTMGPLWDYNLSLGNADYCEGLPVNKWQYLEGCGSQSSWWITKMLQDPYFANLTKCRWTELRAGVLSTPALMAHIDEYADYLREASVRDSARWQTIGNYIWPNAWVANTWQGEINNMKQWLQMRLEWLDNNMYGSNANCNAVNPLALAVDEINFHSNDAMDAGDWLELWNYGTTPLDISNFEVLDGDSYQRYCVIPSGTILQPDERLVLYHDSLLFVSRFPGVANKKRLCFKISNAGQKIVVRDSERKLISSFTFEDSWQPEADGGGKTLQRISPDNNPNMPSSWIAGCMGGTPGLPHDPACNTGIQEVSLASRLQLYPNPATDMITVRYDRKIKEVVLMDIDGRFISRTDQNTISVKSLAPGMYIIMITDHNGAKARAPFVKQ
jgi:hypothetical protein